MPTIVLRLPLFGKMALVKAPVEVAQRVSAVPPPVPQAVPVLEMRPVILNCAQPVEPPADETTRFVVEAVVTESVVLVALVVVELSPVKFWRVEEPVARMLARVARPEELMIEAKRLVEKKLVEVA